MKRQATSRARRRAVVEQPPAGTHPPDYADAFEIEVPASDPRTAEQLARVALEQAPLYLRLTVRGAHRHLLRMRLGPPSSADHVFGWRIVRSEPDTVQLEATSPLLGRAVIVGRRTAPNRTMVTTFVFYARHAPARLVWTVVSPLHRRVAPYLMEHAVAAHGRPLMDDWLQVPNATHIAGGWVIGQIAADFTLLDVWALPAEGGPDEFGDFLEMMRDLDPATSGSPLSRVLFAVRFQLGRWFGWDDPAKQLPIPGCTESTLSDRLPDELRGSADSAGISGALEGGAGGFVPLYRTDVEAAAEVANATVHGVVHLAWADQGNGRCRAQMAVYVKPRGWLGQVYLRLIDPFRHRVVYPSMLRQIGQAWERRGAAAS